LIYTVASARLGRQRVVSVKAAARRSAFFIAVKNLGLKNEVKKCREHECLHKQK
jgi:hypothetical protein